MAKKVNPSNLVRTVRPEGKKNVQWFVKGEDGFARARYHDAYQALRAAGLSTSDRLERLADMKATPYSAVKETKKGLTFVR